MNEINSFYKYFSSKTSPAESAKVVPLSRKAGYINPVKFRVSAPPTPQELRTEPRALALYH